ncbi:MAG: DUF2612 domain-containing protein [Myxococcaceae bacterium]
MNLLLSQFHDSPILNALQNAFLEQIAELEFVFEDLRNLIDQAEGSQLDVLGKIVGQKRFAMSDANYKLWLEARILLNKSRGIEDDLRDLLRILIHQEVEIREHSDIAFTVFIYQVTSQDPQQLFEIIKHAKPLGVQIRLQIALQEPVFRLDTPQITPSYLMECIL